MKFSQATLLLNAALSGGDGEFTGVSTDTRKLQAGNLFVAIVGEKVDGHEFTDQAKEKGAKALLVQKPVTTELPQIQVENTVKALGQLAAFHRGEFNIPLVGITGSCGKTTVTALIASILQQCGETLHPENSFNNEIGLPLTLLRLTADHHYAVIEMGTNHFGEIAYLTRIAKPTVALITNAGPAHLEGLGSVEGVSRAKGEIFQGLATNGTAIINADDTYADYWRSLNPQRTKIDFGLTKPAAVSAKNIKMSKAGKPTFTLITPAGETPIRLPLLGKHNVMNALAAAAVATALNIPLATIQSGLQTATAASKRLNEHVTPNGARLIDDTYNANPLSYQAALATLAQQTGEKVLVLADMLELGDDTEEYHRQLGVSAKHLGIQHVFAFGPLSQLTAENFGQGAQHFTEQPALIAAVKAMLSPQTTVLVKGSRSMHMEKVVAALLLN